MVKLTEEEINKCEYLNAGCGTVRYDDCVNMDVSDNNAFVDLDVVGDVLNIPFPNERFKGVIFSHVLEHLPKIQHKRAILEIRRVLKQNGKVYIEIPDLLSACEFFVENNTGRRDYWYQCIYGRNEYGSDQHLSGLTEQDLTDLLFDCGFGHLEWLDLDKGQALLAVMAYKLDELPSERL
jgi:predicted SAM-dependent methyltransferase